MHLQRATPIAGARRPRVIAPVLIAAVTLLVTVPGVDVPGVDASASAPARVGSCASVNTILTTASAGLLMPSESDFPFTAFTWLGAGRRPLTTPRLLRLTSHAPATGVEVVSLDHFFRNVAQHQSWHDPAQALNVRKFQRLVRVLRRTLTDVRVYRVGTIRIDAYIVGRCGGNLSGLSTTLIET